MFLRDSDRFPVTTAGTNLNVVGSGVVISVRKFFVHESFDPQTFENDIAVLALENVVGVAS